MGGDVVIPDDEGILYVGPYAFSLYTTDYSIKIEEDDYDGYKEVYLDTDDMANFYSTIDNNVFNLLVNEYLLVYDSETLKCVDRLRWNGNGYKHLNYYNFLLHWFLILFLNHF